MMEFHEKLQQLRKQKGLTQEEMAQRLFVSRTAVSKWESDRGYPNIESLKAIAKLFSVSIDELLSGEELLVVAEEDQKQKQTHLWDLVYGLLDVSVLLLLFLPFFGQKVDGMVQAVSLLSLTGVAPYLRFVYYDFVSSTAIMGILTLALQNWQNAFWVRNKHKISLILSILGVLLFMISRQPNANIFIFMFLLIKMFSIIKKR